MNILLLGGYVFLGRALIDAAQARGHTVAAFNRGNHTPMPGVEQITGDRGTLAFPDRRSWDVVMDTSGEAPRHVRSAAELLGDSIDHYIFVSSISVYPYPIHPHVNEKAPLATFPADANREDARDRANYGARKAACEAALTAVLSAKRVLIVRPGFIVGPHDYTERFNSWIERAAQREPLIIPGDPAQPVQLIDVRDLAEWIIAMAERRATGTYNATGPQPPLRALDVAQTCIDATGGSGRALVDPNDKLEAMPFGVDPDHHGIMEINVDRALSAGLRFRPLAETLRDTYAWLRATG